MNDRDLGRGAVVSAFGIGSRPLWLTMGVFAVAYLLVTVHTNSGLAGPLEWAGLLSGYALTVVAALVILTAPGDPFPRCSTAVVAVLGVAALAVTLFSLPSPPELALQTGPATGASVVILAFLAVRGRPLAAWVASGCISVIAAVWAHVATLDAMWGLSITLPGYAIMIMGSLFSVMLRPMARNIYALREANARQAALDAAAAAATEVRAHRLAALDERARPILTRIAERHEFSEDEVATARLLEAQLRDGIRASGLDLPDVRVAAWRARQRGVEVVLLDDGGLTEFNGDGWAVREQLVARVVRTLDETDHGRVTVRIQPPGRPTIASISVDTPDRHDRYEYDRSEVKAGDVLAASTAPGTG